MLRFRGGPVAFSQGSIGVRGGESGISLSPEGPKTGLDQAAFVGMANEAIKHNSSCFPISYSPQARFWNPVTEAAAGGTTGAAAPAAGGGVQAAGDPGARGPPCREHALHVTLR